MNPGDIFEQLDNLVTKEKQAEAALPFAEYLEYEDFIDVLYKKLEQYIQALENDSDQMVGKDEDGLTSELVRQINASQVFDAESQVKRGGGAVDLVVKGFGHEWIAEAKKLTSNDKAFEGILQLVTRYVRRDKKAGLLIYVQSGHFAQKIKDWKVFLSSSGNWSSYVSNRVEAEYCDVMTTLMQTHSFEAHDTYTSDAKMTLARGSDLNVRHFFCNLVYMPMDKSATKAAKTRTGLAMETLRDIYDQSVADTPKDIDVDEVKKALSLLFREVKK
ncbi:TPA: hypothetical protein ACX3CW_002265 [Vibrio parahaemolyticus]|uniref:hypothetical protein n=1 Tax=Vibrio parahaemolyticus TaxID=670 RepID=UPI003B671086|nr:hypothetical protein [Vibrio parahaemolyticus]HCE3427211.1 hypothetical protein [Vibrio parahaemolyticus]HCG9212698.1 hypothetical protein [Vibrio parahaemolyticus]HCM1217668.1 hypothetical protein [Vibrio parahaemolyticus]